MIGAAAPRRPGPFRVAGIRVDSSDDILRASAGTTLYAADVSVGAWRSRQIEQELAAQLGIELPEIDEEPLDFSISGGFPSYAAVVGRGVDAEARGATGVERAATSAAAIAKGRKVADSVYAMVVPGSGLIKDQAEAEGLDKVFIEAGFDWREPGCSMCIAMNGDMLKPGERSASTSNRNFEGRQGPGGRTHLMSPAMAVAAAITGHLTDVRELN